MIPHTLARRRALAFALACAATLAASGVPAAERWTYEVTVTNITYNQRFTPLLLVTHRPELRLFELGEPASAELATLAEEGNVMPLRAALQANGHVTATTAGAGLLDPGESVTLTIKGHPARDRLSLAAMLIPTNDAFVALDAVPLPLPPHASSHNAIAYDAGTEVNDELCTSIPGPSFAECGGSGGGARVGGGEGFVHVHRGVHGIGNFKPNVRDWRNPVARVTVQLVR
jgi:hypothetical protein